jgi:hypothetical protein
LKGEVARFNSRKISAAIAPDVKRFSRQIKRTMFSAHTGKHSPVSAATLDGDGRTVGRRPKVLMVSDAPR